MATIRPFAALHPDPSLAARVCELPYDVVSSEEARVLAADNPLSFFHVSKPEIDLPSNVSLYDRQVYARGHENFQKLIATGVLQPERQACFYFYRQVMGNHRQVGLVAVASCEEYRQNIVKKHELTRLDKEEDRARHIEALNAQTGPAFLVYRAAPRIDELTRRKTAQTPEIDFTAADGVRHSSWTIRQPEEIGLIQNIFAGIPALYIADGHHRTAAAARLSSARKGVGHSAWFLAVIFPHNQIQILPYNRVLRDLNQHSPAELRRRLEEIFFVQEDGAAAPARPHELAFYLQGKWHKLIFRPQFLEAAEAIERLDVTLLQKHVLSALFGIEDPRTSQRLNFVGGIRGLAELQRLVDGGEYACAFALFPTDIGDLMAIADRGGIMPPKSTWFEPKLRDGLFTHLL